MTQVVKESLDHGQPAVSFPTDLPTLQAISVAWIGSSAWRLAGRTELIKKVMYTALFSALLTLLCRLGAQLQQVIGTSPMSSSLACG